MAAERVEIPGPQGTIVGILSQPTTQIDELVIIIHGFSSTKETGAKYVQTELDTIGMHSIRIDLDDQGESQMPFRELTISKYVNEVLAVLVFAKERGYSTFSLVGTSLGGLVALATTLHADIKRLCLRAPVPDFVEHMDKKHGPEKLAEFREQGWFAYQRTDGEVIADFDIYDDAKKYPMYSLASKVTCPTLIVQGTQDASVPYERNVRLAGLLPNARLVLIKGADHGLSVLKEGGEKDYTEGMRHIKNFFSGQQHP